MVMLSLRIATPSSDTYQKRQDYRAIMTKRMRSLKCSLRRYGNSNENQRRWLLYSHAFMYITDNLFSLTKPSFYYPILDRYMINRDAISTFGMPHWQIFPVTQFLISAQKFLRLSSKLIIHRLTKWKPTTIFLQLVDHCTYLFIIHFNCTILVIKTSTQWIYPIWTNFI